MLYEYTKGLSGDCGRSDQIGRNRFFLTTCDRTDLIFVETMSGVGTSNHVALLDAKRQTIQRTLPVAWTSVMRQKGLEFVRSTRLGVFGVQRHLSEP